MQSNKRGFNTWWITWGATGTVIAMSCDDVQVNRLGYNMWWMMWGTLFTFRPCLEEAEDDVGEEEHVDE